MLNITFKDVGQGDSIILQWEQDGKKGVGIIDCNLKDSSNPVLEHIITLDIKEIEFIILSHPHYDHFSGFLGLLRYCQENGIKIKTFLHSCSSLPDFLKTAVKGQIANRAISNLFDFINSNYESMDMEVSIAQANGSYYYNLTSNYRFKILSPSQSEILAVVKSGNYNFDETSPENNPKLNLLSTVIKFETLEGFILFTSDAPKTALYRIDTKLSSELELPLLLGQSPHHGAFSNHNNTFWKKRIRKEYTPIVFSVGKNHYGHVSQAVVDSFTDNEYHIFSTNKEGGLGDDSKKVLESLLDMFSVEVVSAENDLQGDKTFNFN